MGTKPQGSRYIKLPGNFQELLKGGEGVSDDHIVTRQFVGWCGTRTALQSAGLVARNRDFAGACDWDGDGAGADGWVDRSDGRRSRYQHTDRLSCWGRPSRAGDQLVERFVVPHLRRV